METAPDNPLPAARLDDCWNRIGVRGDRSCPELQTYVHCHNCPVYAAAADRLLDAVPPAGYLDEWTELFAKDKAQTGDHDHAVVIFRLGREWLALPTALFREVAPLRTVHTLPHRRDGVVSGIVNVRGELLVCMALDRLLGAETVSDEAGLPQGKHPRLLVLGRKGDRIVFRADEVHGIHRFDPKELQPVPASLGRTATSFTTAMLRWREHSVGCLDEQKLWQTLNRSLA